MRFPLTVVLLVTVTVTVAVAVAAPPLRAQDETARAALSPVAEVLRDANGDTIPDRIDQRARVRGTVSVPSGLLSDENLLLYVQDGTGGIGVFSRDRTDTYAPGDVIEVEGKVEQFRGSVQLVRPRIQRIESGAPPPPLRVPLAETTTWTHFGRLVEVVGVVDHVFKTGPRRARLKSDDTSVMLYFPGAVGRDLSVQALPTGATVSGVGIVSICSPGPPHRQGFQVIVRDGRDVRVIERPESTAMATRWTWAAGIALLSGALLAGSAMARRRVRRRNAQLRVLNVLAVRLSEVSRTAQDVMAFGAETLRKHWLVDAAMLHGIGRDGIPRLQASVGLSDPVLAALDHDRIGMRLSRRIASGRTVDGADPDAEDAAILQPITAAGLHLVACLPLLGRSRTMGSLCAFSRRRPIAAAPEREVIAAAAGLIGLTLENIEMSERAEQDQRELKHLAITDDLTGLYNRRFLEEYCRIQVPISRRQNYPIAFLLCDLDRFKAINDSFGHGIGDLILLSVGERLRTVVRASDLAVRYGGEEFLIVMPGCDHAGAAAFGERLRAELAGLEFPDVVPVSDIRVTLSIGIAFYPDHGDSVAAVLRVCDETLYAAKAAGRDRVLVAGEPGDRPPGRAAPLTDK